MQHTATQCNTLQHNAAHCNTLHHTAPHCYTLQHNNTLQHTATQCNTLQHTAKHCKTMQHTATYGNAWQRTATHGNTQQHTAMHGNALQHTVTHCNTRQRTAKYSKTLRTCTIQSDSKYSKENSWSADVRCNTCNTLQNNATRCNKRQHTAKQCNTLQHTATHCNTLQLTATEGNTQENSWSANVPTWLHANTVQYTATNCITLQSDSNSSEENSCSADAPPLLLPIFAPPPFPPLPLLARSTGGGVRACARGGGRVGVTGAEGAANCCTIDSNSRSDTESSPLARWIVCVCVFLGVWVCTPPLPPPGVSSESVICVSIFRLSIPPKNTRS